MTILNSIAIIVICAVIAMQQSEQAKRMAMIHERIQSMQAKEQSLRAELIRRDQQVMDVTRSCKLLEARFTALQGTTASALNIFEQQILRGAREDLEALYGEMEDGETEEKPADTDAGTVCNGPDQGASGRSGAEGEAGSYTGRNVAGDRADLSGIA